MKAILLIAILSVALISHADILRVAQIEANNHTYIRYFYDCKQFSRDVRSAIMKDFPTIDVLYRIRPVDCNYFNCIGTSLHKFIWIPKRIGIVDEMYIEATTGTEITKDLYRYYSL